VSLIAHWQQSDLATATAFIREAENHDLDGLLDNPQTLRMLFKAVSANANRWPNSKTQTYEMACAQLVREHNDEHLAANHHSALPDDKVLRAAGYLSAILLLSGKATIALQRQGEPQVDTVALPELTSSPDAPDINTCQAALQTRLFRGHGGGQFSPVHRTIGEYLGAQYLVSRINAGLPINRVLALMLGLDAGVVPELRGLHAWLAALAPTNLRKELIDRDPLGAVLNGDVRNFNRSEKLYVLDALRSEAKGYTYFRNQNWTSKPFGALATKDMENDFRQQLQSADRSPAHLALVDCLLDALANGDLMPTLAPELERIVRDKSYWPMSRKEALNILANYARDSHDWSTLTLLLSDIHTDVVEDSEDELLGTLLSALYPSQLTATKIWQYFRQPKSDRLIGSYWRFWHDFSQTTVKDEDLPVLLDALLHTGYQISAQYDHLGSAKIVGQLLVRAVLAFGMQIEISRLYNWLSLGVQTHYFCRLENEHRDALQRWLSEHEATYKALYEYGLHIIASNTNRTGRRLWEIQEILYHAQQPKNANLWYLSLAQTTLNENLRHELIDESFNYLRLNSRLDEALQMLEEWSSQHVTDAAWIAEHLLRSNYPPPETRQRIIHANIKNIAIHNENSFKKREQFKTALPKISTSSGSLWALVEIGNAYLDIYNRQEGNTPSERLLGLLNNNSEWLYQALDGLRQCLFRPDLPSAADIINLHSKNQRYHLASPCLAAMELRYTENPQTALDLAPSTLETVAAFRLTNNFNETPLWFKQLVLEKSTILNRVMWQLISQQIASQAEHAGGLFSLAYDADYATIATQITSDLIRIFPLKAGIKRLRSLRLLIVAMLSHLDKGVQLELISHKLGTNSKPMDVAQQAYWFAAALQIAPDVYLQKCKLFFNKTQTRVTHLFDFIHEQDDRRSPQINLPIGTQAFLIQLLGPRCTPSWLTQNGAQMEMGRYVDKLISALAGDPDDTASQALNQLRQKQDLKHWENSLNRAVYDQRITRRKALFKPSSVAQVVATLANLRPANAADLWALTVDHLKQLIHDIRNGNTNDYRQYWAGDTPKIEDDCRDALLSDLRRLLVTHGVGAEPEGRYADEKRADIKVIATPHQIPIEIKQEMHREVWKAIPEQLIAKYGRELASDGYGIFMVFWFTGRLTAAPSDGGTKPKTPLELQERLAATVPHELRHKIAVMVVDCSQPK
jgi:hypothetical protein